MFEVYTCYDENKTTIAKIRPWKNAAGEYCITERTYKNLLKKRTIGGIANVKVKNIAVNVIDKNGYIIRTI